MFGLQSIAVHKAIGKLHEQYAVCEVRHGVASPATLQCLCNLAQCYCLQDNLSNAEEQLQKALTRLSESTDERPVAVEVLRIRIMLELADVTVQLGRCGGTSLIYIAFELNGSFTFVRLGIGACSWSALQSLWLCAGTFHVVLAYWHANGISKFLRIVHSSMSALSLAAKLMWLLRSYECHV